MGSAWFTADAAVFTREMRGDMASGRALRLTTTGVCRGLLVGTVGLLAFIDRPLDGGPGIRDVTGVAYELSREATCPAGAVLEQAVLSMKSAATAMQRVVLVGTVGLPLPAQLL